MNLSTTSNSESHPFFMPAGLVQSDRDGQEPYSMLIVDDEEAICQLFRDYFRIQGFRVRCAANGMEALNCITDEPPDIIISDIRMPVMDGIELFRIVKEQHPGIKNILMTGYDVDEYLSLIRKHNIGNILVKGADFDLQQIALYVHSILTGNIFGLERYFPDTKLEHMKIDSYARSEEVSAAISDKWKGRDEYFLKLSIDELISNAVFHGALHDSGLTRDQWDRIIAIDPADAVTVTWGADSEKLGVAVADPKGKLKKIDALRWFDQRDNTGRESIQHGRGLFLVRRLIDRFIINIEPGKRTECIILQNFRRSRLSQHKPLQINEL